MDGPSDEIACKDDGLCGFGVFQSKNEKQQSVTRESRDGAPLLSRSCAR